MDAVVGHRRVVVHILSARSARGFNLACTMHTTKGLGLLFSAPAGETFLM